MLHDTTRRSVLRADVTRNQSFDVLTRQLGATLRCCSASYDVTSTGRRAALEQTTCRLTGACYAWDDVSD